MSGELKEIVICLGSSCFARGNKKTLQLIQQYIQDNGLEDKIKFRGNHCFGQCKDGPVLKINGKEYRGVGESDLTDILAKEFNKIKIG